MNGLKKFGLVVAVLLFGPLFLLSVFSFGFNRTLGDEAYTKQTIVEAGFYSAVGDTIVTKAGGEAGGEPIVTAALQSAVSGDRLQGTLEPLIDGTYSWLSGQTQQPQFSLAIEPIKANFQQSLTTALQDRAASLPPCTRANPYNGEDVLNANCIPPGTDVNALITDAVTKVTSNASVFSDEVVADGTINTQEASDLGVNDPTQNLPTALPDAYQFLTDGLWFFIGGTVLTGVGVIFLSKTWLYGLRKLGVLLVVNGVIVLIIGLGLQFVVGTIVPTTSVESTEATVDALQQASKIILADTASLLKTAGVASAVLGIIGIVTSSVVISKKRSPKDKKPEVGTTPTQVSETSSTQDAPKV